MNCIRKQGSCELNSRLKTRKLLGVGETNDGDVHRSKLSQILGHNEQLYVKEPRGLRVWQLFCSLLYICIALSEFFQPGSLLLARTKLTEQQQQQQQSGADVFIDHVTPRLYAAALLSLSFLLWRSFLSLNRELMSVSLLSSIICSLFHAAVFAATLMSSSSLSSSWLSSLLSFDRRQPSAIFGLLSSEFLRLLCFAFKFSVSLFFFYRLSNKY